jgi:hypothetical protein
MLLKPLGVRTVIIGVALVAGIAAGTLGFGPVIASTNSNKIVQQAPVYPTNENGQTYGSGLNAISLETQPDLISAEGEDGTSGYILSADMFGEMPKTPEEALAQQSKRKVGDVRKIPLYAVDGKTVVGVFNIVTTQAGEKPAESN